MLDPAGILTFTYFIPPITFLMYVPVGSSSLSPETEARVLGAIRAHFLPEFLNVSDTDPSAIIITLSFISLLRCALWPIITTAS